MPPKTTEPISNVVIGRDDWDSHWAEYSNATELNPAHLYRRRLIRHFLDEDASRPPRRIVDLGSGQGDLIAELSCIFPQAELLGIELSDVGVRIAADKVPTARFLKHDLLQPAPAESFDKGWADYAICSEVLEHLDDPSLFLRNATAFMACGCKLIVTVPGGPMSAFDRHIGHRKHYKTHELRALLNSVGFSTTSVYGAGYPFFNLYRLAVILRGDALIQDVSKWPPLFLRFASISLMCVFRALFLANSMRSNWGWQIVAVAERTGQVD